MPKLNFTSNYCMSNFIVRLLYFIIHIDFVFENKASQSTSHFESNLKQKKKKDKKKKEVEFKKTKQPKCHMFHIKFQHLLHFFFWFIYHAKLFALCNNSMVVSEVSRQ